MGREAAGVEEKDPRLGMSLIRLGDVEEAAKHVEAEAAVARAENPNVLPSAPDPAWPALDRLLHSLRTVFSHRYGGWNPEMGKDRTVTHVQFVPYPNVAAPPLAPEPAQLPAPTTAQTATASDPGPGGERVRVALLDTEFYPHSRLAGRYFGPSSLLRPDKKCANGWPYILGHAVFTGNLILDHAPAAELNVQALVDVKDVNGTRSLWRIAQQMAGYLDSDAQILNCSWVCYTADGKPPFALARALALLTPKILVVAAAGNHGKRWDNEYRVRSGLPKDTYAPAYPAALPNVLAVGALDGKDLPAEFNPRVQTVATGTNDAGEDSTLVPWIDVLAPGVDITSAYFGDRGEDDVEVPDPQQPPGAKKTKKFYGGARWSGTSMSAAIVTGAIAARMADGKTAQCALAELLSDGSSGIRPPRREPSSAEQQ